MSNIRINNPYLFFVLIPLVAVVLVGFFLLPKQKRGRTKNIISLVLHLVMAVTLTLAFVDIQFIHSSNNTELYILADASVSSKKEAEKMNNIIKEVYDKAGAVSGTKVGVIAFGKDQEVMAKAGSKFSSIENTKVDGSATDLYSALNFTYDQFDKEAIKRIVIVSDGNQTDNNAIEALDNLLSNNVYIDTVSINESKYDEVAITGVEYTDHAFTGRDETVKISIKSKKSAEIQVQIQSGGEIVQTFEDDKEDPDGMLSVNPGLNVFQTTIRSDVDGSKDYEVVITKGGNDTYAENNKFTFTQDYSSTFKVLFLSDNQDDVDMAKALNLYKDDEIDDSYIGMTAVPYMVADLVKYDEIVLSNIDVTKLDNSPEFITNLNTVVSKYGKSLVTYGSTYTGGGLNDVTNYSDMLPVQYESDDGKAIVLLIDNSGSMDTDNRISMAKKGAIAILDKLSEKDYISVITFESNTKVVQPLTSATNKTTISRAINKIKSEGGTEMGDGLREAYAQLKNSKSENKYVITLSDGDPFDDASTLKRIVRTMAADNIVCSFINITNPSGATLLRSLANYGNGVYYYCRSAAQLTNVMLTSVVDDIDNPVINVESAVQISSTANNDAVLENVSLLPNVGGYYYGRIRPQATTVLTVQYAKEVELDDSGETTTAIATVPLYAYWDYGMGRVCSFTTDLVGDKSADFTSDPEGQTFLKNMVKQALPKRNTHNVLNMTYKNNGKTSTIYVTASDATKSGVVKATVTDAAGNVTADGVELYYNGSTYQANVPTGTVGDYKVHLEYTYNEVGANGQTVSVEAEPVDYPLHFDYSSEYDVFEDNNTQLLYQLSRANGTMNHDSYDYKVSNEELSFKSYRPTLVFFLFASVIIFLIDVLVRKTDFKAKKKAESKTLGFPEQPTNN